MPISFKSHRKTLIFSGLAVAWIFMAPSCMSFRKADSVHQKEFREAGVELRTKLVTVGPKHIHYAITGNDSFPTLVFIHGTPGNWDAFARYLRDKELLSKFRMVSIDRPGFGYSDFGSAEHLDVQSELMVPVIKSLANGKPVILVGHSMGGPMIVKLAADLKDGVDGLVVLAGSLDPAAEKPEKWRPWLIYTPLQLLVPGALRTSNEELWYLKKDLVTLMPEYTKITVPVYLLHGDKDQLVPVSNVDFARKMFTKASRLEVILFPGENHFIPWTKFNEIKSLLMKIPVGGQPEFK
jgi:pimeloyl-ACP methyl ester carboxylesterase